MWFENLNIFCLSGTEKVAELLIRYGANVNAANFGMMICNENKPNYEIYSFIWIVGGWTVLHSAVNRGRKKIANLLLRNGANVDAANIYGETPLHWTTVNGYERIAQLLLSSGANVNSMTVYYRTPLHWSAINGIGKDSLM